MPLHVDFAEIDVATMGRLRCQSYAKRHSLREWRHSVLQIEIVVESHSAWIERKPCGTETNWSRGDRPNSAIGRSSKNQSPCLNCEKIEAVDEDVCAVKKGVDI